MNYYQCEFNNGGKRYTYHAADGYEPQAGDKAATETGDCVTVVDIADKPAFPTKAIIGPYEAAPIGHNTPPSDADLVKLRLAEASKDIAEQFKRIEGFEVPDVIEDDKLAGTITAIIKDTVGLKKDVADVHKKVKAPYLESGKACDAWKNENEARIDLLRKNLEKPLTVFLNAKAERERQRLFEEQERQRKEAEAKAAEALAIRDALMAEAGDSDNGGLAETAQQLMTEAIHAEQSADMILAHAVNAKPADLAKTRSAFGGASASASEVWVVQSVDRITLDLDALRHYFSEDALQKAADAFVRKGGRTLRGAAIVPETKLNVR